MEQGNRLHVVVETQEFKQQAGKLMSDTAKTEFIHYIAGHPQAGDIIQETGGARKIRWYKDQNTGKRGGVRVIYYYHNEHLPIFLFTAYGKNQQANLSRQERHELKTIIREIVQTYEEGRHE
jgi:hypothetical protein